MNKYQIAKRHGRLLLNTVDVSRIPEGIEEVKTFASILEANKKLKLLFASRLFSPEEQDKVLKEFLPHLKISQETRKFLTSIVIQGHLNAIKEIIKISTEMYNEKLKKVKALVISPVTLGGDYTERLKLSLKAITQRDVEIESELDPSLIGGFVVKVGSTIYDSSIKGQLASLRAELTR
ncbi:MAG: ATP synthase F1 subunit delta [Nitrospirae bacterium]|nr:ATP synthase F1 subunit delta [Nitrospirota bacterium]